MERKDFDIPVIVEIPLILILFLMVKWKRSLLACLKKSDESCDLVWDENEKLQSFPSLLTFLISSET